MSNFAYPAYRPKRHRFLISCASLAIATAALAPQRAKAQAFQGAPATASGTVSYDRATPGTETITIGSNTATINWTPSDAQGTGNINFLPVGNSATYLGGAALTDFTVLNRILPTDVTRTIELNGSVLSKLSNGSTGGNVWFYSPGGIVIGSGAVFDVGGLLLSSIDLPNGFTAGTGNFSATFSKTQTNAGTIKILSGAQINARNSYVAVVAPRIEQGGNVQVNGSAAYAAADGLTMTMNQGLFNIQVPVGAGTSDGNGIVHTGTTGGSANAAASDHHSIYMVAVPKNQALAMLLGGSIGFAPAAQGATVENGQIVLSAGSSMNDLGQGHFGTAQAAANGNITIGTQGAATFTSTVYGLANGTIHADASSADITFARDATLESRDSPGSGDVSISATSGHQLTVGGNLDVTSSGSASSPVIGLSVNGGSIHVSGDASFTGGSNVLTNANLFAQNGSITIDGDASLDVSVDPFGLPATETNAGDVTGGNINITAGASGTITVGGFFLNADASARAMRAAAT